MDQYCGGIGGNNGIGQWPIPNCGGPMCHHGPGPGGIGGGGGVGGGCGGSGMMMGGGMGGSGPIHPLQQQHGPPPPLPPPGICSNPFSSNNFNSVPLPGPSSRWGPRSSCPVHSPFRVRAPNGGSVCSGHQVIVCLFYNYKMLKEKEKLKHNMTYIS